MKQSSGLEWHVDAFPALQDELVTFLPKQYVSVKTKYTSIRETRVEIKWQAFDCSPAVLGLSSPQLSLRDIVTPNNRDTESAHHWFCPSVQIQDTCFVEGSWVTSIDE